MILLDTSVLSAVLRRRQTGPTEHRLAGVLQGLLKGCETSYFPAWATSSAAVVGPTA